MSVIEKLSSTTGKRSKELNKLFANDIASNNDLKSVSITVEGADNLSCKTTSSICCKVFNCRQ